MAVPTKLKIADRVYDIEMWEHKKALASNNYGEHSSYEMVIRVDESLDCTQMRNTMLHEILHAIWDTYVIKDGDDEERMVTTLANAITATMVDNKELRDWFYKQWENKE